PGQLTRFDASLGLPRAALATLRTSRGELLAATTRGVYRMLPPPSGSVFARFEPYAPTRTTLFSVASAGGPLLMASGDRGYAVREGVAQQADMQLAYAVWPLNADGTVLLAGGLKGARILRWSSGVWSSRPVPGIDTEIRHLLADADGTVWLSGNYGGVYRMRS